MEIRKELPVKWEISATNDLDKIFENIYPDSPKNAIYVVNELLELADSLGFFPEKYPILETSKKSKRNYRWVSKWSFKIIYEVTDNAIWIMKIFDSSKHPNMLFRGLPT